YQVAADLDLTCVAVGGGNDLAIIDHAVFQGGGEPALGDAVGPAGITGCTLWRAGNGAHGGDFHHAPDVDDIDAILFFPHSDQLLGTGEPPAKISTSDM